VIKDVHPPDARCCEHSSDVRADATGAVDDDGVVRAGAENLGCLVAVPRAQGNQLSGEAW
jgi:hypothetical protein